jgi:hypothetical protein
MSEKTMSADKLLREVLKAFYVDPITDEMFFAFREGTPLRQILGVEAHIQLRDWYLENR